MKTPRLPSPNDLTTTTALGRSVMVLASELSHALLLQPSCEAKTIQTDGNFPLPVLTRIRAEYGVLRAQTYETDDPSATIADSSIAWRLSDDPREPGIVIDDMGGLTVGTVYTVKLLIFGSEVT